MTKRQDPIAEGLELTTQPMKSGGWKELFESDNPSLRKTLHIKDERVRATTALMLENERQFIENMDEATRLSRVGGFIDYIYPLIRAVFPNLIAHELCSVQPLQQEHGQIIYLNFIYGTSKGADYVKGQRMFDALTGFPSDGSTYTSEIINNELIGTGTGAATVFSNTLVYIPIRRGKIRVSHTHTGGLHTDGIDDGNGAITGTNIASGTINYETGAITVTFTVPPDSPTNVLVSYEYVSEVSPTTPLIDVQVNSTSIQAIRHSLRFRYSLDGMYEYKAQFGGDISAILRSGMAAIVAAEIDRRIIEKMWTAAGVAVATFSKTVPGAISRREHYGDISVPINEASEQIYQDTHRGDVSWCVVDAKAAAIIKSIKGYADAGVPSGVVGAYKMGHLNGIPIYKERYLSSLPGASADGNILVGYKGNNFIEAGLIYAPYRMFYFTPEYTWDDFFSRRAMASKFGMKLVNGRMYKKITITP